MLLFSNSSFGQRPAWLTNWFNFVNAQVIYGPPNGGTKLFTGGIFDSLASLTWQHSGSGISSITFNSPLTGGTITTSGSVGLPLATSSVNGYLGTSDWTNFNLAYLKYIVSGAYSTGTITFTREDATTFTVTGIPTGTGTVTSITQGWGMHFTSSPLTTTGRIDGDTSQIPSWTDTLLGNHFLVTPSQVNTSIGSGNQYVVPTYSVVGTLSTSNLYDSTAIGQSGTNDTFTVRGYFYPKLVPPASSSDSMLVMGFTKHTLRAVAPPTGAAHVSVLYPANVYSMTPSGTAGTYGSSTSVPVITYDVYGIATGETTTSYSWSGISSVPTSTLSGDVLGGGIYPTITTTLTPVGTAGTYGDATHFPVITTDTKGRVTSVTTNSVSATGGVQSIVAGTNVSVSGTTTVTVTTIASVTPTANTIAEWDANKNLSANSFIPGYSNITSAGTTTTLTVGSSEVQRIDGSSVQNIQLPTTSTLVKGQPYVIFNASTSTSGASILTGNATVLATIRPNFLEYVWCNSISNDATTAWSGIALAPSSIPEAVLTGATRDGAGGINAAKFVMIASTTGTVTTTCPSTVTSYTLTVPAAASTGVGQALTSTDAAGTLTFSNRVLPVVQSTATFSGTVTPNADQKDGFRITALASNITFAVPSGSALFDMQTIEYTIVDNSSSHTLAFASGYTASTDLPLPTNTNGVGLMLTLIFQYNLSTSHWQLKYKLDNETP